MLKICEIICLCKVKEERRENMTQEILCGSAICLCPRKATKKCHYNLEITTIAWRHSHKPNPNTPLVLSQINREHPFVFSQEFQQTLTLFILLLTQRGSTFAFQHLSFSLYCLHLPPTSTSLARPLFIAKLFSQSFFFFLIGNIKYY